MKASRAGIALGAVVLLAIVLRVIGLQYGLPAVYNPDEIAIMARALSFAKGSLNPGNFLYPTFYFYVLFGWVGVYLAFVWLSGRVESIGALQRLYFADPTGIYTAGRTLGVAAGAASVAALYRLGTRLADSRAALAAALFLAVAPLHVRDSHYVKHDVPATLTVVLAYLAMARIWPCARPGALSWRDAAVAGAACGVAFSTHYYTVFLAVPLAMSIVLASRNAGAQFLLARLAVAGAAATLVFLALSPFIVVEPLTAWGDMTANRAIVMDRAIEEAGAFGPARSYLTMLWRDTLGEPVVALAAIGAVWMLAAAPARATFLLAFAVPFLLFISNTAPASRYLNPVLPFAALFAGWTISMAAARIRPGPAAFWIVTVLAATPGLLQSVRADLFFREDDTRTLARRWVESSVPAGAVIAIQPYSVPLTPSREGLIEALTRNLGSVDAASTKFQLQLSQDPYPAPAYRLLYLGEGGLDAEKIYVSYRELGGPSGLAPLRDRGVTVVIVKRYNDPAPETLPFLAALAREGRRVATFSPYEPGVTEVEQQRIEPFLHNTDTPIASALERPGPVVEIWELSHESDTNGR